MSFNAKNMTQGGQVIKYMIGMFMQISCSSLSHFAVLQFLMFFNGFIKGCSSLSHFAVLQFVLSR